MDISFRTETIRKRNLDLIGKNLTILKRLFMVKQERGEKTTLSLVLHSRMRHGFSRKIRLHHGFLMLSEEKAPFYPE